MISLCLYVQYVLYTDFIFFKQECLIVHTITCLKQVNRLKDKPSSWTNWLTLADWKTMEKLHLSGSLHRQSVDRTQVIDVVLIKMLQTY